MTRHRLASTVVAVTLVLVASGCMMGAAKAPKEQVAAASSETKAGGTESTNDTNKEEDDMLHVSIGDTKVSIEWEDNESVDALAELVADKPLSVQMTRYGGFEQVGSLGTTLPRHDVQTTTTSGDIVLYAGNQIVVFYGSNSWTYTRLGHVTDLTAAEMGELLGSKDVVVTISV